jgi:hypothetical protein
MFSATLSRALASGLAAVFLFFAAPGASRAEVFQRTIGVPTDRPLTVILDIRVGRLEVLPGRVPDSVHIEVRHFDPERPPTVRYSRDASRLRVRYRPAIWSAKRSRGPTPEVTIELPTSVELVLRMKLGAGEVFVDLGGLAVQEAELSIWAGEVEIVFGEPNQTIMSYFGLNAFVGETTVRRLGNARFEEANINGGIGELDLDFRGALLDGAQAEIDLDIGETRIIIPQEVGVRLSAPKSLFFSKLDLPFDFRRDGPFYYSPNYEAAEKVLRLRVKAGIGEAGVVLR